MARLTDEQRKRYAQAGARARWARGRSSQHGNGRPCPSCKQTLIPPRRKYCDACCVTLRAEGLMGSHRGRYSPLGGEVRVYTPPERPPVTLRDPMTGIEREYDIVFDGR